MKDLKVGMYILTNSLIIAMIFLGCVSVSFIVGGICKYTLNVTEESGFGFFWMLLFGVCLFLAFIACSLYFDYAFGAEEESERYKEFKRRMK